MNIEEKILMYKGKKRFIEGLSEVFKNVTGHTVESISYEVYSKSYTNNIVYLEYVVVHFRGGTISPRIVNGNSNIANFQVLGEMVDGGYYDEVFDYEDLIKDGYTQVQL